LNICIGKILNLTFPIEWNELGVIATVLAVIVALVANKKATQQLKSALEMQEQSKNVDLFVRRIELAEIIKSGKPVSEITLKVLFDDEIFKQYQNWRNCLLNVNCLQDELNKYVLTHALFDTDIQYKTDMEKRIEETETIAKNEQEITLKLIERFVANSIRSVGIEHKK
jgi:hypothetical protein